MEGFSAVGWTKGTWRGGGETCSPPSPTTPPCPKNKRRRKSKSVQEVSKVTSFSRCKFGSSHMLIVHRGANVDEKLKHKLACHTTDPFRSFMIVLYMLIVTLRDREPSPSDTKSLMFMTYSGDEHSCSLASTRRRHARSRYRNCNPNYQLLLALGLIFNRCSLLRHNF